MCAWFYKLTIDKDTLLLYNRVSLFKGEIDKMLVLVYILKALLMAVMMLSTLFLLENRFENMDMTDVRWFYTFWKLWLLWATTMIGSYCLYRGLHEYITKKKDNRISSDD